MQRKKNEMKGLVTELLGTLAYVVLFFAVTVVIARTIRNIAPTKLNICLDAIIRVRHPQRLTSCL